MMNNVTVIEEGNKLIAEFHGWVHTPTPKRKGNGWWDFSEWGKACFSLDSMAYHESWDWIMPVVKKIKDINIEEMRGSWIKLSENIAYGLADVNIIATWKAVVAFIKWTNYQLTTP